MKLLFILLLLSYAFRPIAQPADCVFKQPVITVHFGSGNVSDVNTTSLFNYERIPGSCPNDGHYTYTNYTSNCFSSTWHTVTEDHTPGDVSGNMMLINSSYSTGTFFTTKLKGLKGGTTYEFAMWLMNVFKFNDNCPFPLLPNLTIRLQTETGKIVAQFGTGEVALKHAPRWTRYQAIFTTPASATTLVLVMINNTPGGCGNDFALDDITLRECVKQPPPTATRPKPAATEKKQPPTVKTAVKKAIPKPAPVVTEARQIEKPKRDSQVAVTPVVRRKPVVFPPPPLALTTRTNTLAKQIETEAGQIKIDLYDNGEIDGDTVSIYHNNALVMAHAKLSQKPLTIRIAVDESQPHHELVMVAENLGSIPPNTSLMIITAGNNRYQVFISSTEQKNAKVMIDLKE